MRIIQQKGFIRNFSILTLSNSVIHIVNLFTNMYLARVLGPESYGLYGVLFTWILLIQSVASLGVDQVEIRAIARNQKISFFYFQLSLFVRLFGLILTTCLFLLYCFFSYELEPQYIFLVILNSIALLLWNSIQGVAFGMQRMESTGIINSIGSLSLLILYFLLPLKLVNIVLLLLVMVIVQLIKDLVYFLQCKHSNYLLGEQSVHFREFIGFVKESFPFFVLIVFGIFTNHLPVLFLSENSGNVEVAYFNTANKLIVPFSMIIQTMFSALFPKLVEERKNDARKFVDHSRKVMFIITICGIVFCLGLGLFRNEIVLIMYGSQYRETGMVLLTQCWYAVYFAILSLFGTLYVAMGKDKLLAILSIINAFVWTPLLWIGSIYGALYVSYAFVLGGIINLLTNSVALYYSDKYSFIISDLIKVNIFVIIGVSLSLSIPDFSLLYRILFFVSLMSFGFYMLKKFSLYDSFFIH